MLFLLLSFVKRLFPLIYKFLDFTLFDKIRTCFKILAYPGLYACREGQHSRFLCACFYCICLLNHFLFFDFLQPDVRNCSQQKMIWTQMYRVLCICFVFSACVGVRPAFFGSRNANKPKRKTQNEKTAIKYGTSWCRTVNIQQEIKIEGCKLKRIRNKACIGKCGSYYLPSKMNLV